MGLRPVSLQIASEFGTSESSITEKGNLVRIRGG